MMKPLLGAICLAFVLVGCSESTTSGAADEAASLAKKSENAPPLPADAQAQLDKMKGFGGKK